MAGTLVGDAILRILIEKDAAVSGADASKGRKRRPAEKSDKDQARKSDGRATDKPMPRQATPSPTSGLACSAARVASSLRPPARAP